MFRYLFALMLIATASSLPGFAADWEGVFSGAIGTSGVIVELNAGEEKSDYKGGFREGARYSYLPKARDISLILDQAGQTLRFTETLHPHRLFADAEDKKITGTWSLKVDAKGATGTWTAPAGGKTLPIDLVRVSLIAQAELPAEANRLSATYDAEWLSHVTLADAGVFKSFGDVEIRKLKDSAFGIEHPVVGAFPDEARKGQINTALVQGFRKEIAQHRDCKNGIPVDWVDDADTAGPDFLYTVDYATPRLLSFTLTGSVFCGGAHPANYVTPITYDLTTAEHMGGRSGENQSDLKPEAFGRILKLSNKDERIAFERFALGRWKEAAAKDKENSENCMTGWIDDNPEGEKDFSLSFTPKGLAVTRRDYPSVAAACMFQDFNPTVIPWKDLKPYLRDGQTLLTDELK